MRIAWIGPEPQDQALLPHPVQSFPDGDAFLLSPSPFDRDAYFVSNAQPGLATLELLAVIRDRCVAPLVLLDEPGLPALAAALEAGADMVLPKATLAPTLVAALRTITRRGETGLKSATWVVSDTEQLLTSPRAIPVRLSGAEHGVMLALLEANGQSVTGAVLAAQIWGPDASAKDNALHATIYRLRRRVEQECGSVLPIRSLSRRGYAFDAPIKRGR